MNGDRVHVRGIRVGEAVEAQRIELQNPGGPGPNKVELEGSDVRNGVEVEVEDMRQVDGKVLASQVEIEDEPNNNAELEGVIQNLTDSCATGLQFTLNGTSVMTNAATRFKDGACSDVRNGVEVEVEGTRQANGKVLALRVEIDD